MRTFDLAPFYRSTVGFDRFFSLLDQATADGSPGYPPYNIEKIGDDAWRIVMALAGFTEAELNVTQKEDELLVTGKRQPGGDESTEYLYQGIAARAFERRFQLADHVLVTGANLENGRLHVELKRERDEATARLEAEVPQANAQVAIAAPLKARRRRRARMDEADRAAITARILAVAAIILLLVYLAALVYGML